MSNRGLFISMSGMIGAGKSTLAESLAKELDVPVHYEPVAENEYLADFYADMKANSFRFQVYLLNKRFEQHQQIIWQGHGAVQDRSIYEDGIFARMLVESGMMEQRDYETYKSLFKNMSNFMRKPDLIVHLDVTPEESMSRIKSRNRECESDITLDYLRNLHAGYEIFLTEISKTVTVIKVRYSAFKTGKEMAKIVQDQWEKLQTIHEIN